MINVTNQRLSDLRARMSDLQIDACIIPSSDAHQSEYVAEHYKSRTWLTGFTGSMGTVVATQNFAGVWADSRYFIQAKAELGGSDWKLQRMNVQGAAEHIDWICQHLTSGSTVGIDGRLFTVAQIRQIEREFSLKGIKLKYDIDIISDIWHENRPSVPQKTIFEHLTIYAGATRAEKLQQVRNKMKNSGADFHLVSTLDDICWMFNLRGNDVKCNPVFYAFAIIGLDQAYLFIEPKKVNANLKTILLKDNITTKPYESINSFLEILPSEKSIAIDTATTSIYLFDKILSAKVIETETISISLKAVKNSTEIAGTKNAMLKDGIALVRAFRWLEREIKKRPIAETEIAKKLAFFRSKMPLYYGESFDAIVGYNANGAIVHYHPEEGKCAFAQNSGILLIDSGGQYQDGTTDITRTIAFGEPSQEQKKAYTLVLKGHIALAMLKFPQGTKGIQMDTLARMFLWQHGMNYGHGTGHGVGCFLNVHEPPQGFITGLSSRGTVNHEPGMLTSNEPGYYKAGEFGIRIENLVFVEDAETFEGTKFYQFDTVTLFPIDTTLIDKSLISPQERAWLNHYHSKVLESLSPALNAAELGWLKRKCKPI
ncbi:MAG: aminopeptidase P family protein [Saprospiraceae bacterium]